MKAPLIHCRRRLRDGQGAFTLIELLTVVAVIGVLAGLLLPALQGAKIKAQRISCQNSIRQLSLATLLYADDHGQQLPYNLGASEIRQLLAVNRAANWANSVLNWELDSDNTNHLLNTEAALGSYVKKSRQVFKCPSDAVLSSLQRKAGWRERTRSYSMNAMVGNAGTFNRSGGNANNPGYRQFLRLQEVTEPSQTFVFIEEHPDSINDGYFVNRYSSHEWMDLPASYHNGSANLSFIDGHLESRTWVNKSTRKPPRAEAAELPFPVVRGDWADYYWLMRRSSTFGVTNNYAGY